MHNVDMFLIFSITIKYFMHIAMLHFVNSRFFVKLSLFNENKGSDASKNEKRYTKHYI